MSELTKAQRIAEVNASYQRPYDRLLNEQRRINKELVELDYERSAKIKAIESEEE